ncbi:hypothetical protein [Treponema pedis]|uniref:hypothetical protein n=1 Tax=Treponema pedis TaxID=409322 RepID=UPI00041654E9|nr:hypothetical protein [Treponema pedis]
MIYTTENKVFFTAPKGAAKGFQSLKNGDTVSAKILSLKDGGTARIFFNGAVFEGTVSGGLKEGDFLKMRVIIKEVLGDAKVFLVPETKGEVQVQSKNSVNFFSELGLPKTELSSAVLNFLTASGSRLNGDSAYKLFAFLKDLPKKKTLSKAVFAAGLMLNKGIELNEDIFKTVYAAIFGEENSESGGEQKDEIQEDENEVLELLNHLHKGGLNWAVFPFKKELEDTGLFGVKGPDKGNTETDEKNGLFVNGSLALLLDLNLKTVRLTVLHCKFKNEDWVFILKDKIFAFECENVKFTEKEITAVKELFLTCLQENGLNGIEVRYGINNEAEFKGVDIMI